MTDIDFALRAQTASRELGSPRPMRRGVVSVRRIKCHKSSCACAHDPERRHGPYVSWVRGGGAKTRSKWLSPEVEPLVRKQILEGKAFLERVEALFRTCEQWAEAELQAASDEVAEKRGSRQPFRRKSRKKSKR